MVFPVVMYGCDSWTIKKAKHWRIDAFELWCWRRLLRVPWTARRSNQSILKEISPECSLEGLMLKLKLQPFGHLMRRADWFEKTLVLGKIEGGRRRGWDGWMASLAQWTWVWASSRSWRWTGKPGLLWFTGSQRVGHDWVTELNWTSHTCTLIHIKIEIFRTKKIPCLFAVILQFHCVSHSVVSNALWPPWTVGHKPPDSSFHGMLLLKILKWVAIPFSRGSSPSQRLNPCLLHCRQILYHLSHQGSPLSS